jgi:hypothetical protein
MTTCPNPVPCSREYLVILVLYILLAIIIGAFIIC